MTDHEYIPFLAMVILVSFNSFSQTSKTYKKREIISSHRWSTGAYVYCSVTDRKDQIKSVNELNAIGKKSR